MSSRAPSQKEAEKPLRAPTTNRNVSIDLLRGVVMVVMALDHVRDYFGSRHYDPADLTQTTPILFLTRWITHYCAPVFVFLAGTSVYLSQSAGKPLSELRMFLLKRGLWLVLLEITVVRFGWLFNLTYRVTPLQVIWAIGCSMLVLALVLGLSVRAIAILGGALVVFHNMLDHVHLWKGEPLHVLWSVIHEQDFGIEPLPGMRVIVFYPLVPWIGVMMLGYALGAWMKRAPEERQRLLFRAGIGAIVAFFVIRGSNLYGDPRPWIHSPRGPLFTFFSILDCQKYPPSLCYLLMTLGPSLCALALFDKWSSLSGREADGALSRMFIVFGRVPLFYYVAHLMVIHAVALALDHFELGTPLDWDMFSTPIDWGLGWVYVAWIAIVGALYPVCRWYARVKGESQGNAKALLSYL